MNAPGRLDTLLFLAIVLVSSLLDWKWLYPSLKRASVAGRPGARTRFYAVGIAWEWGFVACVAALWVAHARPWSALWLGPLTGGSLALALVIAAGGTAAIVLQQRSILSNPKGLEAARRHFAGAEALLPCTAGERVGFTLLSVTAGVCEEILFRGFVVWCLAAWLGPLPAYAIAALLFGFAHIYLSPEHAVRAAIAGVIATCMVVLTGSLLPAIVLHAVTDVSGGIIGHRLVAGEKAPG